MRHRIIASAPEIRDFMGKNYSREEIDDSAVRSYFHSNRLIRAVFWKRLQEIVRMAGEPAKMLDFGGGNLFLAILMNKKAGEIVVYDIKIPLAKFLHERILNRDKSVRVIDRGFERELKDADLIVCADVLEHMDNRELMDTFRKFHKMTKKGTRLIISGPTENFLYKIGRRIAGFSGEYHKSDIETIRKLLEKNGWKKSKEKVIYQLLPLFKIYLFVKK
jgi:2-polyprenyl-3-methyl-5-hydroxy-6-metoxy-1,4-benzoquinol methylase